jgi:hypothetical protein
VGLVTTALRLGAVCAIGIACVSGCGGADDADEANPSQEPFCSEMRDLDSEFSESFDPTDPASIRDALAAVDPPETIADDFATLVTGFDRLIETGAVPSAEQEVETYEATISIDRYVADECGFELDGFARSEPRATHVPDHAGRRAPVQPLTGQVERPPAPELAQVAP